PLTYEFMQRGLLASVIVGVLCAVMGTYVVLRGMAFLGDAMAHAILPGVAIAYILKGDLLIGAGVAAVASLSPLVSSPKTEPSKRILPSVFCSQRRYPWAWHSSAPCKPTP
ncbi:metal ABC transporter permease, partial [Candidatus Villigracilis vicinus]|uniref:metal ABC transporter permease n=1 Tax=Candidatus Villigracilis vicinus TaxID=3140679 RepID=UPI0031EF4393